MMIAIRINYKPSYRKRKRCWTRFLVGKPITTARTGFPAIKQAYKTGEPALEVNQLSEGQTLLEHIHPWRWLFHGCSVCYVTSLNERFKT